MDIALILDFLIAGLLVTTIVYAVMLNRKLKKLRASETEMRAAIDRFNESATLAESNLARIRDVAASDGDVRSTVGKDITLEPLVAEARKLATDLNLLIERGESVFEHAHPTNPAAQPKQVKRRKGLDMANPHATWSPGEEFDLADALRGVR